MLAHVGGRAVEGQQIVLEDLDVLEAGGGDGLELLDQTAAQTHRGNGKFHVASSGERGAPGEMARPGRVRAVCELVGRRKMLCSGMRSESLADFSSRVEEHGFVGALQVDVEAPEAGLGRIGAGGSCRTGDHALAGGCIQRP